MSQVKPLSVLCVIHGGLDFQFLVDEVCEREYQSFITCHLMTRIEGGKDLEESPEYLFIEKDMFEVYKGSDYILHLTRLFYLPLSYNFSLFGKLVPDVLNKVREKNLLLRHRERDGDHDWETWINKTCREEFLAE